MKKILFVCHGNICRSTMAEYVMKKMVRDARLEDQFEIASAATSREEIGNGVHHGTRRKLAEVGVPCGEHRAVQITKKDYENYDFIIGMDDSNIRNIKRIVGKDNKNKVYRLLDFSDRPREIADPWYTRDFEKTFNEVVEGCNGLLKFILEN